MPLTFNITTDLESLYIELEACQGELRIMQIPQGGSEVMSRCYLKSMLEPIYCNPGDQLC